MANTIIVQAAYMSGDMFGMAAALKLYPNLYVLIVFDPSDEKSVAGTKALYDKSEGATASGRVKTMQVTDSRDFYKSIQDRNHAHSQKNRELVYKTFRSGIGNVQTRIRAIGASTKMVVDEFKKENNTQPVVLQGGGKRVTCQLGPRERLVEQWRIDEFDELGIARFLHRHNIGTTGKYLFLWIRRSGHQGGAHLEHDASADAWQQIINQLTGTYADITPVLIGDQFDSDLTGPNATGKPINLTKFWEQVPFCLYKNTQKFSGAEARRAQFALFDYMQRAGYKTCHLGMRSGVLESVALMGVPVIYMEERNNQQGDRIKALADSMGHYGRIVLDQLPSVEGQVIDRNQKEERSKLYNPHITSLKNHCGEQFGDVARRISAVESALNPGVGPAAYEAEYIRLSQPAWADKFPGTADWNTYKVREKHWCEGLTRRLTKLYNSTWSTAKMNDGFVPADMKTIMKSVRKNLP